MWSGNLQWKATPSRSLGRRRDTTSPVDILRTVGGSVAAIFSVPFSALIASVAEVVLHLAIQHDFKDETKDFFESILHVLDRLWMILVDNCLASVIPRRGNLFDTKLPPRIIYLQQDFRPVCNRKNAFYSESLMLQSP